MSASRAPRRPFRFGVTAFARGRADWLATVRNVEDLGFSSLVIPDHFGGQMAPLPALVAAAGATSRLRLGTLVFDNDFRHPAALAKEVATADLLSDGRFEVGVGAGWMPGDYQKTGIPLEPAGVRVGKLEETLRILKLFFTGEPVTFHGRYYHLDGLDAAPRTVQQPGPPIMVGGSGPRMLRLMGRHADIASLQGHPDPPRNLWGAVTAEHFAEQIATLRAAAGERADAIEISVLADIHLTDNRAAELRRLADQFGLDTTTVSRMPAVFVGSVDAIADQMQERREQFGISYPVIVGRVSPDAVAPMVARLTGT